MALRRVSVEELMRQGRLSIDPASSQIEDVQAVSNLDRFKIKLGASNKESARQYLLSQKNRDGSRMWDIVNIPNSYGANLNFGIRRAGSSGPWRVLDPSPANSMDFIKDLVDISADTAIGFLTGFAATGGAFVGNLPGAAVAAGAAGAGGEALRQAAGQAAGLPNNMDPFQIGAAGVFSAAGPPVAKAAGGLVRALGQAGAETAGALVGVKPFGRFSRAEGFMARSALGRGLLGHFGRPLTTIQAAAPVVRKVIGSIDDAKFPEAVEAARLAAQVADRISITKELGAMRYIAEGADGIPFVPEEFRGFVKNALANEPSLSRHMRGIINSARTLLEPGESLDGMSIKTAIEVKRLLQNRGRDVGGFFSTKGRTESAKFARQAVTSVEESIRTKITDSMHSRGFTKFGELMSKVAQRTRARADLFEAFAIGKVGPKAERQAELAIRSMFGRDDPLLRTVQDAEKLFGLEDSTIREMLETAGVRGMPPNVSSIAFLARLSEAIAGGTEGAAGVVPRFSAVGLPIGAVSGGALGTFIGGPAGSIPGAAIGTIAAIPRVTFNLGRAGIAAGRVGSAVAGATPVRTTGFTLAQSAGRSIAPGIAREDTRPSRRVTDLSR